jgi:transglutaminase-like putative cysteine protease
MTATLQEYLPVQLLWRLLGVLLLVVAPLCLHVPVWESLLVVALGLWRGLASQRQWRMPPAALRAALTLGASLSVYLSFGRITGQQAGVALLVLMLALKLTELRARRDVTVLVFLMYFVMLTHFLYSQDLWTAAYLLICSVAITATLIEISHPGHALGTRKALRLSGRMVAWALPLMLLMFVLFPRIPGPLWGLPPEAGGATSGLSDDMSPGDISDLSTSEAVAFRVEFQGAAPPSDQRYWRGATLNAFDGRRWTQGFIGSAAPSFEEVGGVGEPLHYTITLEPTGRNWLFALDAIDVSALPAGSQLAADLQLLARNPLRERERYELASFLHYRFHPTLAEWQRRGALRLPPDVNPRTRALAQQWLDEGATPRELVERARSMIREQQFAYTLRPSILGRESVDDFLFNTREGYCEHYASAFSFLMRAAGVPSRVVIGYLGGERNPFGGYYVVRQADAHAWSEVWFEDEGWVRVDPTRFIAPERVRRDGSVANAGTVRAGMDSYLAGRNNWAALRYSISARWDWINARWNGLVLGYGMDLQLELLSRLGIRDWRSMTLALTVSIALVLAAFGLLLLRRAGPSRPQEPALRLWRAALKRLQRHGFEPQPGEGPRDFALRVMAERPALEPALSETLDCYLQLRYAGVTDPQRRPLLEQRLARALRRI